MTYPPDTSECLVIGSMMTLTLNQTTNHIHVLDNHLFRYIFIYALVHFETNTCFHNLWWQMTATTLPDKVREHVRDNHLIITILVWLSCLYSWYCFSKINIIRLKSGLKVTKNASSYPFAEVKLTGYRVICKIWKENKLINVMICTYNTEDIWYETLCKNTHEGIQFEHTWSLPIVFINV